MGRNKIEMKKIVGKPSRSVTFTKRRQGLFKKAAQLCVMCDAQIAIIVFSDAKKPKPYTFGHSSVDTVLQHYANRTAPLRVSNSPYLNSLLSSMSKLDKELENEKQGAFWWEKIQVEEIECLDELESMKTKLEKLRESLVRKLEKMELERLSASLLGDDGLVNNDFTLTDENGSDLLLKEDDNLPVILDSFAATNSSEAPGNVDSLEDISSWLNTDNSVNGFYGGVDSV